MPGGTGSGDSPGSVNAVEPSKMVTDHSTSPLGDWISAPCRLAPGTAVKPYVPAEAVSAPGGGSQLCTATVPVGFTLCSQAMLLGSCLSAASRACASRS